MLEIKITVELPGIPEAINHLADALLASKVQAITPAPVVSLPVAAEAETAPVPVEVPAPTPVPEKKTRKRKEAPAPVAAPVEQAEDAPPLAEVPVEPEAHAADPEPVSEATPQEAAADLTPAVTQDIPADDTPVYTIDLLSRAGTALLDKGKMGDLLNLLGKYNASSLMDLKPEQYAAFAQEMKAIGADLP